MTGAVASIYRKGRQLLPDPVLRQRHGNLVEALKSLDDDTRLLVIGKQGVKSLRQGCRIPHWNKASRHTFVHQLPGGTQVGGDRGDTGSETLGNDKLGVDGQSPHRLQYAQ